MSVTETRACTKRRQRGGALLERQAPSIEHKGPELAAHPVGGGSTAQRVGFAPHESDSPWIEVVSPLGPDGFRAPSRASSLRVTFSRISRRSSRS